VTQAANGEVSPQEGATSASKCAIFPILLAFPSEPSLWKTLPNHKSYAHWPFLTRSVHVYLGPNQSNVEKQRKHNGEDRVANQVTQLLSTCDFYTFTPSKHGNIFLWGQVTTMYDRLIFILGVFWTDC
jgi:hypothetical protein